MLCLLRLRHFLEQTRAVAPIIVFLKFRVGRAPGGSTRAGQVRRGPNPKFEKNDNRGNGSFFFFLFLSFLFLKVA